jgi:hypothetical protein
MQVPFSQTPLLYVPIDKIIPQIHQLPERKRKTVKHQSTRILANSSDHATPTSESWRVPSSPPPPSYTYAPARNKTSKCTLFISEMIQLGDQQKQNTLRTGDLRDMSTAPGADAAPSMALLSPFFLLLLAPP